jgi:penicillin-binding protein 1A
MLAGLLLFGALTGDLPSDEEIVSYRSPQTSKVYARDGRLVATLYEQNRTPVKLEKISRPMQEAIVAIEDSRFYDHDGVDGRGVVRAFLANLRTMSLGQGAGTITMQLARNRFLSNEKTFRRKLREAVLARRMENLFSKDQILELYLNQVYFGHGAYGIDAAASAFFSKNPSQLTYAESALLAGLVQAPAHLSPF